MQRELALASLSQAEINMDLMKRVPYRNKKWLDAARDQSCVNCTINDGTVVAAHYQGIRAYLFGKGKGQKPDDCYVADLCRRCHAQFDNYFSDTYKKKLTQEQKIDLSEQFMFCVLVTLRRRIDQGVEL